MSLPTRLLIHSAQVERVREIPTSLGGERQDYEVVASGVACRFQQGSPSELNLGGIELGDLAGEVWFAASADVGRGDRLTVDSVQLEVLGVQKPSVRDHYLKATVRERQRARVL